MIQMGERTEVHSLTAAQAFSARALHERRRADPALDLRGDGLRARACRVHRPRGARIPDHRARTDTGKTTTCLKTLDGRAYSFLSDDLTLLSPEGRVLPYPKPLTISRHTLQAVNRRCCRGASG